MSISREGNKIVMEIFTYNFMTIMGKGLPVSMEVHGLICETLSVNKGDKLVVWKMSKCETGKN